MNNPFQNQPSPQIPVMPQSTPQGQTIFDQYGGLENFQKQITNFAAGLKGDPRQIIQGHLNDGSLSQQAFEQYGQIATNVVKALTGVK